MSKYIDPIIKKYFELFESAGVQVKKYYQGEPFKIAASEMPALFMQKTRTDARPINNAQDEHEAEYRITVVADVRNELDETGEIVAGIAQVMEILEGRELDNDSNQYKLKTNSVLHVLRNNTEVDAAKNLRTDLRTSTRVDYGDTINRRDRDWFVESHIDFVAHFIQTR